MIRERFRRVLERREILLSKMVGTTFVSQPTSKAILDQAFILSTTGASLGLHLQPYPLLGYFMVPLPCTCLRLNSLQISLFEKCVNVSPYAGVSMST